MSEVGGPVAVADPYALLLEHSSDGVLVVGTDGSIVSANRAACAALGYDWCSLRRMGWPGLVDPTDERLTGALEPARARGSFHGLLRARRADGSLFTAEVTAARVPDGPEARTVVLFRDVSGADEPQRTGEMQRVAIDMQRAAATLVDTLESISDAYIAMDKNWVITYVNGRAEELLGVNRWQVLGDDHWKVFPSAARTVVEGHYRRVLDTGEPVEFEHHDHALGRHMSARVYPLRAGRGIGVYLQDLGHRDVAESERQRLVSREESARAEARAAQQELGHRAAHDTVTGLLNRWGLMDRVTEAVRATPTSLTILFVDLDRFKAINDTLGHLVGDEVLAVVADRLRSLVGPEDLLARFGGDEFVIALPGASPARAEELAAQVVSTSTEPVTVAGNRLLVTASVGIARAETAPDLNALLRESDAALFRAKELGRDGFAWFDERLHDAALERITVEQDLRHAVESVSQLELHFQPAFDLGTGDVVHIEALARWNHPVDGSISPARFIPVAEESGLIVPLGDWVIGAAAAQAAVWSQVASVRVWVNISARQLALPCLCDRLAAHLDHAGVPPYRFGIEVTETAFGDDERLAVQVQAIRDLGIAVAIDDFGTGFSSLARLARMPADVIKIDRSFVAGLGTPTGDALVAGIVSLAHALGAAVIAEGVETPTQLHTLNTIGCETAAGYHLARPSRAHDMRWRPAEPVPGALRTRSGD